MIWFTSDHGTNRMCAVALVIHRLCLICSCIKPVISMVHLTCFFVITTVLFLQSRMIPLYTCINACYYSTLSIYSFIPDLRGFHFFYIPFYMVKIGLWLFDLVIGNCRRKKLSCFIW